MTINYVKNVNYIAESQEGLFVCLFVFDILLHLLFFFSLFF